MRRVLPAALDDCRRLETVESAESIHKRSGWHVEGPKASRESPLQRLADGLLRVSLRFPRAVVGVALLVTLAAFVYARDNLSMSASRGALHEQKPALAARNDEYNSEFPDADDSHLVVVIEAPTAGEAEQFAAALTDRLQSDRENVVWARYKADTQSLRSKYLLYLSPAELEGLESGLKDHADLIREFADRPGLVALLTAVNYEVSRGLVSHFFTDFLDEHADSERKTIDLALLNRILGDLDLSAKGEAQEFRSPWAAAFSGGAWKSDQDALYWADSRRLLLLQVRIRAENAPTAEQVPAVAAVRSAVATVRTRFPRVHAGVTGGPALDVDELDSLKADMGLASALSVGGVFLLLIALFRSSVRPTLGLLALGVGVVWAFAFAAAAVGHLNIISATLAPMLIGLGMDNGIHLLSRYQQQRSLGQSIESSLRQAIRAVLRPLVSTAASIATAFYALLFTGVSGLSELGVIAGSGILLVLLSTLVVFPPLLLLYDSWHERRGLGGAILRAEGDRPVALPLYRRSSRIVALGVAVTAVSLLGARRLGYDFDLLHLQAKGTESVETELRLLDNAGLSAAGYGVVLANSLPEARSATRALETLPSVSEAVSIASLIPEEQKGKIARIREMSPLLLSLPSSVGGLVPFDPRDLEKTLVHIRAKMAAPSDGISDSEGEKTRREMSQARTTIDSLLEELGHEDAVARLRAYESRLVEDFRGKLDSLRGALDVSPVEISDLPEELRERFVGRSGRYLIEVFPKGDFWEPEVQAKFVADLRSVDPLAVGEPVLLYESTQAMKRGYSRAGVLAVLSLLLISALSFRRFRDAALAAVPLLVGSAWTVGLMSLFGLRFNLGNLLTLPLMVGAGMENGIVLIHRYREDFARRPFFIPRSTGLGVILASTTTMVGFASLLVARHRGVYSVGLLLLLAVGSVFAASFTVLPALLRLLDRGIPKPPETSRENREQVIERRLAVGE
jgi:uncharacterized protein